MAGGPIKRELLTTAIATALRLIGPKVGESTPPAPPSGKQAPELPYLILDPLDWDGFRGPPQNLEADATLAYQVTAVGERRDQLEALMDEVRWRLLHRDPVTGFVTPLAGLVGLSVIERRGVSPSGIDASSTLLSMPERFIFEVTTS